MPAQRIVLALVVSALVPWAGCGDSDGTGPRTVDAVVITTADGDSTPQVRRGETIRLVAAAFRGGDPVGGIRFRWRSETPTVATVDSLGAAEGLEYGAAAIVAEPVDATGATGRVELQVVGPPVAGLDVVPADTAVDLADTVRLRAVAYDSSGAPLAEDPEVTWRASSGVVTVGPDGDAVGQAPGEALVEAVAWDGTTGSARVRVTPVGAIEPDRGPFGLPVTVRGTGLPSDARIFFAAAGGGRVEAFLRSAGATAIELWVPVDAVSGPLFFRTQADSFATSRTFTVEGTDDALEPNRCDQNGCLYASLPVPYTNPSLLARDDELDLYAFEAPGTGPFTVFLAERDPATRSTVVALLLRLWPSGAPREVWAYLEPRNYAAGTGLDSVAASVPGLPADTFRIWIAAVDTLSSEVTGARHAYGLTLARSASTVLAPDALEPNDVPEIAPRLDVPVQRAGLSLENPWAMDHYVISVAEPSDLVVAVDPEEDPVYYYLIRGDTVDVLSALFGFNDPAVILAGAASDQATQLEASVGAGTYTVAVGAFAGNPTTYDLRIEATPSAAGAARDRPAPAGEAPRGRLPRLRLPGAEPGSRAGGTPP